MMKRTYQPESIVSVTMACKQHHHVTKLIFQASISIRDSDYTVPCFACCLSWLFSESDCTVTVPPFPQRFMSWRTNELCTTKRNTGQPRSNVL